MYNAAGYDAHYFRSVSGFLKLYCLVFELIGIGCIICSIAPLHNLRGILYIALMAFAFCCTLCVYLWRLFQIRCCRCLRQHRIYFNHGSKLEVCLNAFLAFCSFIAASAALTLALVTYSVAAFFGFLAFLLYALDTWLCFRQYRLCDKSTQTLVL